MSKTSDGILSLSKSDFMRSKIIASLRELLQVTSFDRITVTMICNHAGISRSSFYHLFSDLYEALEWELERLFNLVIEQYPLSTDWRKNSIEIATVLLKHIAEDDFIFRKTILDTNRVDNKSILTKSHRHCYSQMYLDYIEKWGSKPIDDQILFEINLFINGASDVLEEWMISRKGSPEWISERITSATPPYLAEVLDQCERNANRSEE